MHREIGTKESYLDVTRPFWYALDSKQNISHRPYYKASSDLDDCHSKLPSNPSERLSMEQCGCHAKSVCGC